MNPDRGMAEHMRATIETDGDRLTDLHLWRLGPGHLGAIVAVATPKARGPDYYQSLVEKHGTAIADEAISPSGDDHRANQAGDRIHPGPAEQAAEQQADNDHHRNRSVAQHVDDGGTHIVVALHRAVGMFMLDELDGVDLAAAIERHAGDESVRLRDFADSLEIARPRPLLISPSDRDGFDDANCRFGRDNPLQLQSRFVKQCSVFGLRAFLSAGNGKHDDVEYLA